MNNLIISLIVINSGKIAQQWQKDRLRALQEFNVFLSVLDQLFMLIEAHAGSNIKKFCKMLACTQTKLAAKVEKTLEKFKILILMCVYSPKTSFDLKVIPLERLFN